MKNNIRLGYSWKHIVDKSEEEIEELVKNNTLDYLRDIYYSIYDTYNAIISRYYEYSEAEKKIKKLKGKVIWDEPEIVETLKQDSEDFQKCLNRINKYTIFYHGEED